MVRKNTNILLELDGNSLTLENAVRIAKGAPVGISENAKNKLQISREFVEKQIKSDAVVYGVTTGFGFYAKEKISSKDLLQLQKNLLRSHAAGYGTPLSIPESRLALALRLNVLLKGYTGVRLILCEKLLSLIEKDVYPIIPEYGSVGASGDLAPLAHLALTLIGEGEVYYRGKIMPASKALKTANITPLTLHPKEGLSLINGTQIMLAVGGLALSEGLNLLKFSNVLTALSYEGMNASLDPLNAHLHEVRGQVGQIFIAKEILKALKGSYLHDRKRKRHLLQDPYSLRCSPQIHGPSYDALQYAQTIIERELNAATDNPLVFVEEELIISGGNFHGQALAMAFDIASIALAELGSVSERRLELLLNPHLSGLPAFLSPDEGLCSGYMAAQYLSASLVNENKLLANPTCTDSIPGNVGIEDHVSMGMTSARKLKKIVSNLKVILAIELVAAAQAIDLRGCTPLGESTGKLFRDLRKKLPPLTKDRIIADDFQKAIKIINKHFL